MKEEEKYQIKESIPNTVTSNALFGGNELLTSDRLNMFCMPM